MLEFACCIGRISSQDFARKEIETRDARVAEDTL